MNAVINKNTIHNVNINDEQLLMTPDILKDEFPLSDELADQISRQRKEIANIIHKKDKRLLIVIGPCSIHDTKAALEYADKLKVLAEKVKDHIYVVMRVYFEKPRTTVGWKGLINDPKLMVHLELKKV